MPEEEKEDYRGCDVGRQFGWMDLVVKLYLCKIGKRAHVSKPQPLFQPMKDDGRTTHRFRNLLKQFHMSTAKQNSGASLAKLEPKPRVLL